MAVKAAKGVHYYFRYLQVLTHLDCDLRPFPAGCDGGLCYQHFPNPHMEVYDAVVGDDTMVYVGSDDGGDNDSMDSHRPNNMVYSNNKASPNTNSYSNRMASSSSSESSPSHSTNHTKVQQLHPTSRTSMLYT